MAAVQLRNGFHFLYFLLNRKSLLDDIILRAEQVYSRNQSLCFYAELEIVLDDIILRDKGGSIPELVFICLFFVEQEMVLDDIILRDGGGSITEMVSIFFIFC